MVCNYFADIRQISGVTRIQNLCSPLFWGENLKNAIVNHQQETRLHTMKKRNYYKENNSKYLCIRSQNTSREECTKRETPFFQILTKHSPLLFIFDIKYIHKHISSMRILRSMQTDIIKQINIFPPHSCRRIV